MSFAMNQDDLRNIHASDCAVHNEPASPAGECDCDQIIEVVLLLTPDGRWGARALEPDERQSDVAALMLDAWRDSLLVSDYQRFKDASANPTAVLQKMSWKAYMGLGCEWHSSPSARHWIHGVGVG